MKSYFSVAVVAFLTNAGIALWLSSCRDMAKLQFQWAWTDVAKVSEPHSRLLSQVQLVLCETTGHFLPVHIELQIRKAHIAAYTDENSLPQQQQNRRN